MNKSFVIKKGVSLIVMVSAMLLLSIHHVFASTQDGVDIGSVLGRFKYISDIFSDAITPAAVHLFWSLVILDIVVMVIRDLKDIDPIVMFFRLLFRTVLYGVFAVFMTDTWLFSIIDSFVYLGKAGSGIDIVRPSDIFLQGLDLVGNMTTMFAEGPSGTMGVIFNPFAAIAMGLAVIITLLSFLVIAAQFVLIKVQMYFFLAISPALIALGGFFKTRDLAFKTISSSIVIGVRLLSIYFVLAVARDIVPMMGVELAKASLTNLNPIWTTVGMAFLLAILAVKLPSMAADMLSGSASLSAGDAMMPGSSAAAGAIAGAVAGGMVSGFKEIISRMPDGPIKSALDSAAALREATDLGQQAGMGPVGAAMNGFGSSDGGGTEHLRPSWMTDPNPMGAKDFAGAKTAQGSSDGGQTGSIGGAGSDQSETSRFGASVAEHVRGGLQEFAQAEKAPGASVNIHGGHED